MKNTSGYGWPYPESGDHTRTWEFWEAQVKAIENTIRNGYRMFGNLEFGDDTSTVPYIIGVNKKEGADIYRAAIAIASGGQLTLTLLKNSVEVNRLRLGPDGNIYSNLSTQSARGIPYAMAAGANIVTVTNSVSGMVTVTFPAGRFTQPPRLAVTSINSDYHATFTGPVSAVSFGAVVRSVDLVTGNNSVNVDWIAAQMLATAGSGLMAAPQSGPQESVTCRTAGCFNEGIAIVIETQPGSPVQCGVCGQLIGDRTPA